MRIISKIHDYYDGAMAMGVDTTRVFVRAKRDRIYLPDNNTVSTYWDRTPMGRADPQYTLRFVLVGFCGELYPCVKLIIHNHYSHTHAEEHKYIYDATRLTSLMHNLKNKSYQVLSDEEFACKWLLREPIMHPYWASHNTEQFINKFTHVFADYSTPYFVVDFPYRTPPRCDLMPLLKEYNFYKIKDCYTAYLDIDMFLHNQLCDMDNPHIDPIPDVVKAESKGFNKFSFRKDKQIKK